MIANSIENRLNKVFYTLIGFIILFTTTDIVAGFSGEPILAASCSMMSMIIVFVGYFKTQRIKSEQAIKDISRFVRTNFDKWQIILSVIDVICSIVVIFVSMIAVNEIFRVVFAVRIFIAPARIITFTNKFKTITKPFFVFCFLWAFNKFKNKLNNKENKMSGIKTFFKKIGKGIVSGLKYIFVTNPQASLATLGNLALSATAGITVASDTLDTIIGQLPQVFIGTLDIIPICISILLFIIVEVLGVKWAFETNSTADARKAITSAEKEKIALAKAEEKAKIAQEKKDAEDKKKALALAEKKQAEANAKIAEIKEEERLLAIAAKLKAEEDAKKQAEATTNVVVENITEVK